MRRILAILAVVAVVVVAVVVRGGGGGTSTNDDRQVRATLAGYTQAGASKDYATICKRFLAPRVLDQMRQIKLPCKRALARSVLGTVKSPTLTVKSVKVTGTTALAEVHTGAADQPPLDGTIELVKVGGLWQILSQVGTTPKAAAAR